MRKLSIVCAALLLFLLFALDCLATEEKKPEDAVKSYTDLITGIELLYIPGGCYEMGCGDWMDECREHENPAHTVCVDGFYIGKYEVTQGQWQKIMGENPSDYKGGENNPVEMISWSDAQEFIKKLNIANNEMFFRLPTEAEWEYAARSRGKEQKYSGGNSNQGGLWHNFVPGKESKYPEGRQTMPVGTANPNDLGLYDMSGNVAEWVEDWYAKDYYSRSPQQNPQNTDSAKEKVYRGGTYIDRTNDKRTTNRIAAKPDWVCYDLGFRVVAVPK
jgi:formylglycine-generating enzyme required for sulfatase activity